MYAHYDRFAAVYDRNLGRFALRVLPALEKLVLRSLAQRARILDVCCGTGQLAAALTERGFAVTGVDGSEEMLRIARRNAPAAEFVLADVRSLTLPAAFDAALSTFDSINHIVEPAELAATFANVFRALRPGGMFVFDMNMEEGFLCRWWGTWRDEDRGSECAIQAVYCPETKLGRNIVTLRPESAAAPAEISFVERCYTESAVRDALTAAGFQAISAYDGHRDLDLIGEMGRSFFVCHKPLGPANRRWHRSRQTCVDDSLWPAESLQRELGDTSKRMRALEEVLCTLPPQPYEQLKREAFEWFIPSELVLGQVHAFGAMYRSAARVVYFSPLLEQQDLSVVILVAAHELAHVILGHQLTDLDPSTYRMQEEAVGVAVREWGFQPEADAAALFTMARPGRV